MGRMRGVRIEAGADTIDVAKTFGELRRGGAQMMDLGAIDLEASGDVGPVRDRGRISSFTSRTFQPRARQAWRQGA